MCSYNRNLMVLTFLWQENWSVVQSSQSWKLSKKRGSLFHQSPCQRLSLDVCLHCSYCVYIVYTVCLWQIHGWNLWQKIFFIPIRKLCYSNWKSLTSTGWAEQKYFSTKYKSFESLVSIHFQHSCLQKVLSLLFVMISSLNTFSVV